MHSASVIHANGKAGLSDFQTLDGPDILHMPIIIALRTIPGLPLSKHYGHALMQIVPYELKALIVKESYVKLSMVYPLHILILLVVGILHVLPSQHIHILTIVIRHHLLL